MGFKRIVLALGVSLAPGCATVQPENTKEFENFRNYALGVCLGAAFPGSEVASDVNKALNGYLDRGNMSLEAYDEIRVFTQVWLAKDYSSKSGTQIQSMKCFDFSASDDVVSIYKKYDPCKSKQAWLDGACFVEACSR
ncbi:MAG: T6SS amidase immunity protein Tai4 family protein [Cellvibrio sp.]